MPLPLLQLPGPALDTLVALLPAGDRGSLRLCSSAAAAAVDLHTTRLRIIQAAPPKPLQHRFPSLVQLEIDGTGNGTIEAWKAAWQPFASLPEHGHWARVTRLHLTRLPASIAAAVISSCPSTTNCSIRAVVSDPHHHIPPYEIDESNCALLCHVADSLPALRSLQLFIDLGDADLAALARSSSLQHLRACQLLITSAGVASLCSMRLVSLSVGWVVASLPDTALSALSSLTALTHLAMESSAGHWAPARLPQSLVSLEHCCGVPPGCVRLPQLTCLRASARTLDETEWGFLASACPVLASLSVHEIRLSEECHATPLAQLTKLVCTFSCSPGPGLRFGLACPKLQILKLACDCWNCKPQHFEAAQYLERLDLGCAFDPLESTKDHSWTVHLKPDDFSLLAALPNLRHLRLDAMRDHVEGVSRHFTSLHSITWALHSVEGGDALIAAFALFPAPLRLVVAHFQFVARKLHYTIDDDELKWSGLLHSIASPGEEGAVDFSEVEALQRGQLVAAAANAAVSWLLSAPCLTHVTWMHDEAGCAAWNDAMLCAVAGHAPVHSINLLPYESQMHTKCYINPGTLERVRRVHAAKGLKVLLHGSSSAL